MTTKSKPRMISENELADEPGGRSGTKPDSAEVSRNDGSDRGGEMGRHDRQAVDRR